MVGDGTNDEADAAEDGINADEEPGLNFFVDDLGVCVEVVVDPNAGNISSVGIDLGCSVIDAEFCSGLPERSSRLCLN